MNKLFKILTVIFLLVLNTSITLGSNPTNTTPPGAQSTPSNNTSTNTSSSGPRTIKVLVTEKIPGVDCKSSTGSTSEKPTYECTMYAGLSSFQSLISEIIRFFTAIAALAGILFIVINGILLSMGSKDSGKSSVKGRIVQGIVGLILLLLSGMILNMIAPWVYNK